MGKESKRSKKGRSKVDLALLFKAKPTRIPRAEPEAVAGVVPQVDWKKIRILAAILCAVVVTVFAITLWGGLVLNDAATLSFLNAVRSDPVSFWSQLWNSAFTSPLSGAWLRATYAWDFQAAGSVFAWFHAVNIGLHLVACLYLFAMLFRLSWRWSHEERLQADPYHVAFAATLIFACHPLVSEPVAYLSARVAPLLAANYFLALNCFLVGYLGRSGTARWWGYGGALAFLCVGLLVSAQALTLPLAMLALAGLSKKPGRRWLDWAAERKYILGFLIILQCALPYLLFGGVAVSVASVGGTATVPDWQYWAMQLKAFAAYYVRCFLVPIGLSIDPPVALPDSWLDPLTLIGAAMVLGAIFAIWFFRRRPVLSLACFLFVIGFIPDSLIVQPEAVADRRVYLSLAGLCTAAGWGFASLAGWSLRRAVAALTLVVLVLAGLTIARNIQWLSTEKLWRAALEVSPGSSRARAMLALEYLRQGKAAEAGKEAGIAVKVDEQSAPGHLALGGSYYAEKKYEAARDEFRKALELSIENRLGKDLIVSSATALAETYSALHEDEKALALARQYAVVDPGNARLHLVIGKAYLAQGHHQLALGELQSALALNPALLDAVEPTAKAALELGVPDVAVKAARILNQIDKKPSSRILVARAEILAGNLQTAAMILREVVKEDSKNAEALALSSWVASERGQKELAADYRKKALNIDEKIFSKVRMPKSSAPVLQVNPEARPSKS